MSHKTWCQVTATSFSIDVIQDALEVMRDHDKSAAKSHDVKSLQLHQLHPHLLT